MDFLHGRIKRKIQPFRIFGKKTKPKIAERAFLSKPRQFDWIKIP